jgi:hypothetical protein
MKKHRRIRVRLIRVAWSLCFVLVVLGGSSFQSVRGVSATTGNSNAAVVPAHFKVPHRIAVLYPGQYVLRSAAGGARLRSAQMVIEINTLGFLQGIGSFFGCDAPGYQTTRVAAFYNFHVISSDRMAVEIFDATGTHVFGNMYLRRTKQGNLIGQIALPKTLYAIQFSRKVAL